MKIPLFIILFLQTVQSFSQSRFVIDCKTNAVIDGKAIIGKIAPEEFNPVELKKDTVLIRNHSFAFVGTLKYPEQFRIEIIDNSNNHSITEPFFIGSGYQKMTIDTPNYAHDFLKVGIGVNLQNSNANEEYVKKYLPLYKDINKRIDAYVTAKRKCYSINDTAIRKDCTLTVEAERISIRKSSDSTLLSYAKTNPNSPIVPWLLYDAILDHGYTDYYKNVFEEISAYTPASINKSVSNFLLKQKLKAPGNLFPLIDFVNANITKDSSKSKYTLVEFWFSGCAPCIAQFGELKHIYKKFNKKGFEIVAISIDKKEAVSKYKELIEKNGYAWPQILDLNGTKTKTIDINSFPSSFLLDSRGVIVKTNVNPEILNSYLEDNL